MPSEFLLDGVGSRSETDAVAARERKRLVPGHLPA